MQSYLNAVTKSKQYTKGNQLPLRKFKNKLMLCSSEGNISDKECTRNLVAVSDALYAIGGKWKLPVIVALKDGAKRFNELQRTIPGISAKVLSNELKEMELNGFVKRNIFTKMPVVVEYELTDYSKTLKDVLTALREWGTMHREWIMATSEKDQPAAV